ncbi:hypothetical protein FSP39_025487 [Pinctada imbricata]|uniref:Small EDRK-rich factor-like N-terminal domain-containing protein n=1 Tax=Pinctada imbricata TaxID=66713 RepID=A0AA88Y6J0_PINIB|nr:hypothetical protein FSP39_025487 [Pinctada imbricata]
MRIVGRRDWKSMGPERFLCVRDAGRRGGNQREKSREKAAKKQKETEKKKSSSDKSGNKGLTLEERRHRDAEIMRQKQVSKAQGAEGGASK